MFFWVPVVVVALLHCCLFLFAVSMTCHCCHFWGGSCSVVDLLLFVLSCCINYSLSLLFENNVTLLCCLQMMLLLLLLLLICIIVYCLLLMFCYVVLVAVWIIHCHHLQTMLLSLEVLLLLLLCCCSRCMKVDRNLLSYSCQKRFVCSTGAFLLLLKNRLARLLTYFVYMWNFSSLTMMTQK